MWLREWVLPCLLKWNKQKWACLSIRKTALDSGNRATSTVLGLVWKSALILKFICKGFRDITPYTVHVITLKRSILYETSLAVISVLSIVVWGAANELVALALPNVWKGTVSRCEFPSGLLLLEKLFQLVWLAYYCLVFQVGWSCSFSAEGKEYL